CIASMFRREVYETIGGFDERFDRNEDYQFWIRAAHAGFAFLENATPLALYRRRPDSVSADEMRMLTGIMRVLRYAGELCPDDPKVYAAIDRQMVRLEGERLRASAKTHLSRREYAAAAQNLEELHRLDGSPL